jgi:hypothetical protein
MKRQIRTTLRELAVNNHDEKKQFSLLAKGLWCIKIALEIQVS